MQVADILSIGSLPLNGREFDVCLDKGTYDVVSLSPSNAEGQKATYVHSTASLLKEGGLLIVASCNWTEEELREQFESGKIGIACFNLNLPAHIPPHSRMCMKIVH